jgi:Uma2 family endonuclease
MNEPAVIDPTSSVSDPYQRYIDSILPKVELVYSDGEPMESQWHVWETRLLLDMSNQHFHDRNDCFFAANMFLYYSEEQARNRDFKGPDFFFAKRTHRLPLRLYWATWLENGRTPNVVIELCSPTTIANDYGEKKDVYEQSLRVFDYFCYDPTTDHLDGWRLKGERYEPLTPNEHGQLWSEELELWLGVWRGAVYESGEEAWLRFFDARGNLILTPAEEEKRRADEQQLRADEAKRQADEAKRQADEAKQRALKAETELQQLRERLAALERQAPGANPS